VIALCLADTPDSFEGVLVADAPSESVGRIGRVDDEPAPADDLRRTSQEPLLRILGVHFEQLAHSLILRAVFRHTHPGR
jgi:hypothetical protein